MEIVAGATARPATARTAEPDGRPASPPLLSIIIPCYNEAQRIGPTLVEIERHFAGSGLTYELLVVDDGSTDGTVDLVAARARLNGALRVIGTRPNRGKGHAVRTGALAARGDIVMFTDADLSIPITIVDFSAIRADDDIAPRRARTRPAEQVCPPLSRRIMTRSSADRPSPAAGWGIRYPVWLQGHRRPVARPLLVNWSTASASMPSPFPQSRGWCH
jgi:glycosyltransferase involved in cell wall biosynthesis